MLKLQYFGHLKQRANSLEKTLILGKSEGEQAAEEEKEVGAARLLAELEGDRPG